MVNKVKTLMLSHSHSLFFSYTRNTQTSLKGDFKIHYEMTLHHTLNVHTHTKHNTARANAIVQANYKKKK